jgi:GNAT superfamily N-acetyltransferase
MALAYDDIWLPLDDAEPLTVEVPADDLTGTALAAFDLHWDGLTTFVPAAVPANLPADFGIGVIVGASGSGKSTMLETFGANQQPDWGSGSIGSHFLTADEAADRFYAVGLNAAPTWGKPYDILSTGERFRVDLARRLHDGAVIDEFTSVVDRTVATSVSNALRRYVAARGLRRMVLATCHRDILPWLQPDWVIDTDIRCWALRPRGCLQRPNLVVRVHGSSRAAWRVFAPHHYLSQDLHPFARCFVGIVEDRLAAFAAVLPFPNGNLRNAWRGHRTVVLPDYQGLGIGMRMSDWIGQRLLDEGKRYYSKTAHPRMVAYRNASPAWRNVSSRQATTDIRFGFIDRDPAKSTPKRLAVSHEYVGLGA